MQTVALEKSPADEVIVEPSRSGLRLRITFPGHQAFAEMPAHDVLTGREEVVWADFLCLVLHVTGLLPSWDPEVPCRVVTSLKVLACDIMTSPSDAEIALAEMMAAHLEREVLEDQEVGG